MSYCTISTGTHDNYRVHAILRIPDGREFRDDWKAFWKFIHPQPKDLEVFPPLPDKALKKTDRGAWKRLAREYSRVEERNLLRTEIASGQAICSLASDLGIQNGADDVIRRAKITEQYQKSDWSSYANPELSMLSALLGNLADDVYVPTFLAYLKGFGYEELPYFDANVDRYQDMVEDGP